MVMPGDNVEMMCEIYNSLALESGQRFNVREGGRTVSEVSLTSSRSSKLGKKEILADLTFFVQVATGLVTRIL